MGTETTLQVAEQTAKWFLINTNDNNIIGVIDLKFSSGISKINFGFYPYTDVCYSTVYNVLSRVL